MTRNFELGKLYYDVTHPLDCAVVKMIACPKCKADISKAECMVKSRYFLMGLLTVNILSGISEPVSRHLRGAIPVTKDQYEKIRHDCKSRLLFVEKF